MSDNHLPQNGIKDTPNQITFAEYKAYETEKSVYSGRNRLSSDQNTDAYAELKHLASLSKDERDRLMLKNKNRKKYLEYVSRLYVQSQLKRENPLLFGPEWDDSFFHLSLKEQQTELDGKMSNWVGASRYLKGYAFAFAKESCAKSFLNKVAKEGVFSAVRSSKIPSSHVCKLSIKQAIHPRYFPYPETTFEGAVERKRKQDYTLNHFIVRSDKKYWVVQILDSEESPL